MANKKRSPSNQLITQSKSELPNYDELTGQMVNETTSALTDYYRQFIGVYGSMVAKPGDAIFINWDPVIKEQTYRQWAQYDLYWYLEQDPHIRSILSAAKVNVSGLAWKVKPYLRQGEKKPTATNAAVAEFIREMFEQMETFPQHLYNLMDALPKGFSFSEIIWQLKEGYWIIERLMNRTQRRIQFDATNRQPKIRTQAAPFYGEPIPVGKYIVHRASANWENPFGDAVDQSLYWMWLFKHDGMKFYLKHLEVGSSSIPIVQHPVSADPKMKAEAMTIASDIRNGAYGRLPDTMKIIWAESQKGGDNAQTYDNFIKLCNEEMTKCVKGQTLTTEGSSSSGMGSRGMGKTHQITEDQFDIFRARGLAGSINKYLVKFAVDYNFAKVEGYPRFEFDVEEEINLETASTVLVNLVKALPGYDVDINEVQDKFGYTFIKKEKSEPIVPITDNALETPPAEMSEHSGRSKELTKLLSEFATMIDREDSDSKQRIKELEDQKDELHRSIIEMGEKKQSRLQKIIERLSGRNVLVNVEPTTINVPQSAIPAPVVNVQPAEFKQQPPNIIVNVPKQEAPIVNVKVEKGTKKLSVIRDGMGYIKEILGS